MTKYLSTNLPHNTRRDLCQTVWQKVMIYFCNAGYFSVHIMNYVRLRHWPGHTPRTKREASKTPGCFLWYILHIAKFEPCFVSYKNNYICSWKQQQMKLWNDKIKKIALHSQHSYVGYKKGRRSH